VAAEAGNNTKLQQYLVGASADELRFEERDFAVSRVLQHVMWPLFSMSYLCCFGAL
jgi:hypothetical protein